MNGMSKRKVLGLLGSFGLAAYANRSAAQFGRRDGRSRGGAESGSDRTRKGAGPEGSPPPAAMLEVALHEFQEDLKLRPEQEPLFEAYVERVRALAQDAARQRRLATEAGSGSVMQRIDRNVDWMRDRFAALEDIAVAAKALYATLAPEQQAAADPRLATLMVLPLNASAALDRPAKPTPSAARPPPG